MSAILLAVSCQEKFEHKPIGEGDNVAPNPVKDVVVTNTNGGAVLHYTLPDNPDILYVKASYLNSRDIPMDVKVSTYVDSLVIEGLGDTKERDVELVVVDHFENASTPVHAKINPLIPAVETVYSSLDLTPNFGGFILSFTNPAKAAVSFYIHDWDPEQGKYVLYDVLSSKSESGTFTVKGFDDSEHYFAVSVRDKYDNESELFEKTVKPLYEEELVKSNFKLLNCDCDVSWNTNGGNWQMMFDGLAQAWNYGHVDYPVPFPHSFTIDLAVNAKLSEIKFWQSQDSEDKQFAHGCPKHFRCYGCVETADYRNLDNWILLFDGYLERPSGGQFGIDPLTEEDLQAAKNGHVFPMDPNAPTIRYFRFQSLASWSGMETSLISEFSIFGAPER